MTERREKNQRILASGDKNNGKKAQRSAFSEENAYRNVYEERIETKEKLNK